MTGAPRPLDTMIPKQPVISYTSALEFIGSAFKPGQKHH